MGNKNEKHHYWLGDKAKYSAKHCWIRDNYGVAILCVMQD